MSKRLRGIGLAALLLLGAYLMVIAWTAVSAEEGVIYYILTEDNEITLRYPIRMGGEVLTREVFETLMIHKVDRINEIAEKYGAKWTHMTAVGPWFMAKYAEKQSGDWAGLYDALVEQVRRGSAAGHEYAVHPHAHWDPRTSFNAAIWDPEQNGFVDSWEDYLSWTMGFMKVGDLDDLESSAGYLYDHKRRIMEITRRETVVHRSGGWQFGNTPEQQVISLNALKMNGILANSDADSNLTLSGNAGRLFHESTYFTAVDSINERATSAKEYGTLEFAPNPIPIISFESNSVSQLNLKVDQAVAFYTDRFGRVTPGVHFITGFGHAKNIMGGDGTWSSLEGGQFDVIDQHLAYVFEKYVNIEKPLIRFATATEAVLEYYDYYSERPVAVRSDEERQVADRVFEYPIRVLGRFGPEFAEAEVQPPIWWDARSDIKKVEILEGGEVIAVHDRFESAYPYLAFPVKPRTKGQSSKDFNYSMRVYLTESAPI